MARNLIPVTLSERLQMVAQNLFEDMSNLEGDESFCQIRSIMDSTVTQQRRYKQEIRWLSNDRR